MVVNEVRLMVIMIDESRELVLEISKHKNNIKLKPSVILVGAEAVS